jgi:hypothetical protein
VSSLSWHGVTLSETQWVVSVCLITKKRSELGLFAVSWLKGFIIIIIIMIVSKLEGKKQDLTAGKAWGTEAHLLLSKISRLDSEKDIGNHSDEIDSESGSKWFYLRVRLAIIISVDKIFWQSLRITSEQCGPGGGEELINHWFLTWRPQGSFWKPTIYLATAGKLVEYSAFFLACVRFLGKGLSHMFMSDLL